MKACGQISRSRIFTKAYIQGRARLSPLPLAIFSWIFAASAFGIAAAADAAAFSSSSLSSQQCDPRCRTGNCDGDGACICNHPHPSTILDGDRRYYGGQFCDEERLMCDGSNEFWCENGAVCNEIVQGENYTCICSRGYSGEHCQITGVPCGDTFCYHNAECLQTEILCDCPPNWRGSKDCSLPTEKRTFDQTVSGDRAIRKTDEDKLHVPTVYAVVGVVMVIMMVVGRKLYMKRNDRAMQFRELRQVQMGGLLADDEDEEFVHKPLANGDF